MGEVKGIKKFIRLGKRKNLTGMNYPNSIRFFGPSVGEFTDDQK